MLNQLNGGWQLEADTCFPAGPSVSLPQTPIYLRANNLIVLSDWVIHDSCRVSFVGWLFLNLTKTFTIAHAADGRNDPARRFNKSRFGGLSRGRHPIKKGLPRHTPIVRNATDHRKPSQRTGKTTITPWQSCNNKINGCFLLTRVYNVDEKEQLLLSVLPEHVAVKMRQDLGTAHDGQFKKIYMSRHENVRLVFILSWGKWIMYVGGDSTWAQFPFQSKVCSGYECPQLSSQKPDYFI